MSPPGSMEALRLPRFGGPNVLRMEEVPTPEPDPGEVLIEVAFCGVCRHDLLTRAGAFPSIDLPVTPGHQVSGWISETGEGVEGFAAGGRVMTMIYTGCGRCAECRSGNQAICTEERPRFLGEDFDGGYAPFVKVRQDVALPVPDGVGLREAAIVTCTLGTAYHAVVTRGGVSAGDAVAITGASGGVGLHAIKLARHFGAHVIAVTSSAAKEDMLRKTGVDEVIVSPDLGFAREVKALTGSRGADVVVEIVGAKTLDQSIRAVRQGGTVVVLGNVEGGTAEVRPAHLILKELNLLGTKSCTRPELEAVLGLISSGAVSAEVEGQILLKRGADLHRTMEEGRAQGRLVLEVAGE